MHVLSLEMSFNLFQYELSTSTLLWVLKHSFHFIFWEKISFSTTIINLFTISIEHCIIPKPYILVITLSTVLFLWKCTYFNYNSLPLFLIGVSLSQSLLVGFPSITFYHQYSSQSVRLFQIASN